MHLSFTPVFYDVSGQKQTPVERGVLSRSVYLHLGMKWFFLFLLGLLFWGGGCRRKYNKPPDAMMTVMNALAYDAMAVGNHEYEFGLDVLNKARGEAQFPWLSANTYKKGTDESYFKAQRQKLSNYVCPFSWTKTAEEVMKVYRGML